MLLAIGFALALAVALLAAGLFPQEPLRRFVERRLREALGPATRLDHLHVVPGTLRVEIRGLVLEGPAYRLEVPHARAQATLDLLLSGQLSFERLEAEGARLTLRAPDAARATPAEPFPEVRIASLRLTDSEVRYHDPALGGEVVLRGVEAEGAIGAGPLDLRVERATWHRPSPLVLAPVRARIELSPDLRLRLESLQAATAASRLQAEGGVGALQAPELDLRFTLSLDLAEMAALTASPTGMNGRVEVHGALKGDAAATHLEADASGQGLRIEGWPGALGGHAEVRGDPQGSLAVSAQLAGNATAARMRHAASVQVQGTWDAARATVDLGWRGRLDSQAAAPAAEWPLRQARLTGHGRAFGPLPPRIDARVEGQVRVAGAAGGEESLDVRGEARVQGRDVSATVNAHGAAGHLGAVLETRGERVEKLEVTGQRIHLAGLVPEATGEIDLTGSASGPFDRLTGQASASASGVTWRGVRLETVRLDAGMEGGQGTARLTVPAFKLQGDATWNARADVAGRLTVDDAPLSALAPLFGREVEGRVKGEAEFSAPGGRWADATARARIAEAEVVSGNTYARLTAPAVVDVSAGRARTDALALEAQGAQIRAEGEVGLQAAGPLDLRATVTGQLDELDLPNAWNVSGEVEGHARVQGTWSRPVVAGEAAVRDLLVVSPAAGEAVAASRELLARFEGERLLVEKALIEVAGGELELTAEVPLAGLMGDDAAVPGRARVEASFAAIDLGVLASASGRGTAFEALVSGRLSLEAPPTASFPDAAQGTVEMDATTARVRDLELQVSPVRVDVRSGAATLHPVQVTSAGSRLDLQGSADLAGRRLQGNGRGELDLRALNPLLEGGTLSGLARLDVAVNGPLRAPQGEGSVVVEDATLRIDEIPQALSSIQGTARLSGNTLVFEEVSGQLGGGTLNLAGTARLAEGGVRDVRLEGSARDVSLRYPRDFKSRVHADLRLTGNSGDLLLSGQVRAERGLYDTDIDLLEEAFRDRPAPPAAPSSPLLATISLDLQAFTENPILIRNNLARIEATGRLQVRGDLRAPAPYGRLEVAPGGEVYLQTREFVVESGSITYAGGLDPSVALRAKTLIKEMGTDDVEVTVTAEGPLLSPALRLSSDPAYSEKEIASLITGGRRNLALDNTAWVAGEHAALLLGGRLERRLERQFQRLGLDEVDIEPELLAREADPSARFTFGKQLTPQMKLIYSTGLRDAEARFFEAQYRFRLGQDITLKLQRDEEAIYSYGAGQRLRFGAPTPPRRSSADHRTRLAEVRFTGQLPLPEDRLRAWTRVKPGQAVTYWDLQGDAERLEKKLHDDGFLEALVTVHQEEELATFHVRGGARYDWRVSGLARPPDLQGELRGAFSEEEALERGRERLREAAHRRGYWRAEVDTRVEGEAGGTRTLVFVVEPGPHIARLDVSFPGAQALSARRLLEAAGGKAALLQEPEEARQRIQDAYRAAYYLEAQVERPRVAESESGAAIAVAVPVAEGPRALVTAVEFPGATLDAEELSRLASIPLGQPYHFDQAVAAVQKLRDHYLRAGYARVRVHPTAVPRGADLVLQLEVREGPRSTVGPTVITGLHRTRESLVRGRVALKPGDPLDPRQLSVTERRLLDLDVFSRAVVTTDEQEPATIRIEVEEEGPYAVAYDVRFSQEDKTSGTVDAEVGNLFGLGLSLGARYRLGADIREARGSLHLPALGRSGDLTAALFQTEEDFQILGEGPQAVPSLGGRPFLGEAETEVQRGFQLQRATHPREGWDLLYGYRFKRITSRPARLDQNVSGFDFSVVNDRRDDPLDATRGHFLSLTLEAGPRWLGSDFTFARFLGQAFFVRQVGPVLSWAQGYRLGLARGLDEQRLQQVELFGRSSELFRTGGANTLRGFATDSVGPPSRAAGVSAGGEAMVVLNQELRYRLPWGLGAAVFWDAGNVFEHVEDVSLSLRHSLGLGLRYQSPAGLLRVDVGFPLGRRRGEGAQWFFSLGQAF